MTDEELQAIRARLEVYHVCVPGTDEDLYAHASTDIAALVAEVKAVRTQRDVAVKEREAALDCHPGDGVSFCGACVSCLSRVNERIEAERDAARAELRVLRATMQVALNRQGTRPDTTAELLSQILDENEAADVRLRGERDAARAELEAARADAGAAWRARDTFLGSLDIVRAERDAARAELESHRRLLGDLVRTVSDTYGEAVQSGIIGHGECANHEWDNRTRAENAVWLISRRTLERDAARAAMRFAQAAIKRRCFWEEHDAARLTYCGQCGQSAKGAESIAHLSGCDVGRVMAWRDDCVPATSRG